MSGTAVTAEENLEETYFRRLFDVLGAKGIVVLVALPAAVGAASVSPEALGSPVAGVALTGAFLYSVLLDKERSSDDEIDAVGVSFAVVAAGYTALTATGIGVGWLSTFVAALVVFGAVVYGYAFREGLPDDLSSDSLQEIESDPLHIDVVGFAVAEILVVYSILDATGWGSFANSDAFGALAFLVYVGTVATFSGYAVVTREIVVSRTDDEVHELLVGVLGDIAQIDDDVLREDLASKMRLVAEGLDGAKLPTEVEDDYGEVPVVLSTRKPDARRVETDTQEVIGVAKERGFTGYAVHGDTVMMFRNGTLAKYYRDGEYGYEADELEDEAADATFHSLGHQNLNHLDDITPKDETVVDPDEVDIEEEEEEEDEDVEEKSKTLNVGGEEIDMEEMFEKADEIMDELSE